MPRQREFDPDQVLEQAMRLFWRQGYHKTSLQDLEAVMNINRFSIYATFESKHSLFLAALQRYRETVIEYLLRELDAPDAGLEAIRRFFLQFPELASQVTGTWGCLICNSAAELALFDADVIQEVNQYKVRITSALRAALNNAQRRSELSADAHLEGLEVYLLGALFGLMLYIKTGATSAVLTNYVMTVLNRLT